jgi:hypothetical protein
MLVTSRRNHMTKKKRKKKKKKKTKKCQSQWRLCLKHSHTANQPLLHYKCFALVRLLALYVLYHDRHSLSRPHMQLLRCQPAIKPSC